MAETTAFGRYLRQKRVAAKLSLREVAERLGVSHVFIGELERGVRGVLARERWEALVAAIPGVSRDDLERHASLTKPLQLQLTDAPPQYQDLALALARRIERRDLPQSAEERQHIARLIDMLKGEAG
jgi:transcriptional regulator with XRE-family HTH domain